MRLRAVHDSLWLFPQFRAFQGTLLSAPGNPTFDQVLLAKIPTQWVAEYSPDGRCDRVPLLPNMFTGGKRGSLELKTLRGPTKARTAFNTHCISSKGLPEVLNTGLEGSNNHFCLGHRSATAITQ